MVSFQIASDLHIEYKNDESPDPLLYITPSADVLILAGDIGSVYKYHQLETFMKKLCTYFKIVLYVIGNKEYYDVPGYELEKMDSLFDKLMLLEQNSANLYILNRKSVLIDDVCIAGCTLWSYPLVAVPSFIVRINDMNTHKYKQRYKEDFLYIKNMINYCSKKKLKLLVVTHHCPTYNIIKQKSQRNKDRYTSLYASSLDYLLKSNKVHTWVCGHIHINFDYITEGGTHLVGNQVGKPKDRITDYSKSFVIKV